jgi:cytochrome oxidase Cu insertion factor (SCO1/SenC/PrrC family)
VALTLVRPAFDLADRQGARFTEAQLPGHVWVVAFVEPTCLACAERVADAMAELGHRTRNLWPMFGLLTVALGPVLPGPEAGTGALRASRLLEGPDAPGLRTALAEGDPDQATALGQGRRLAVLDARGRLRARYDNDPAGLGRLLHDVSLLANRGD